MSADAKWMRVALDEARKAFGQCHPNPAVGAIVVHREKVIAKGYTQCPGKAHAEVMALEAWRAAGAPLDDTTALYVTLEPCCTQGRTPPCTSAIVASGIRRVVVGATDPNPSHAGQGYTLLREAAIEVENGVLESEVADLNLVFNFWIQNKRPFIAAKTATTLDGFIATRTGHSKWVTGEAARQDVARWRRAFPAIGVGAGTVMADDPQLTSRVDGMEVWCPRRLVFDRKGLCLKTPEQRVFTDEWAGRTMYLTSEVYGVEASRLWAQNGVEIVAVDSPRESLQRLSEGYGLSGVYLEGGTGLWGSFFKGGLIDYLFSYQAPKFLGDSEGRKVCDVFEPSAMSEALVLKDVRREFFDPDLLTRGFIQYPQ